MCEFFNEINEMNEVSEGVNQVKVVNPIEDCPLLVIAREMNKGKEINVDELDEPFYPS